MKTVKSFYLLSSFLMLISFSQLSNAIIISSYTGLFEDGSRLVVDLKGYDYGEGSHRAVPYTYNESGIYLEGFDTTLYPSRASSDALGEEPVPYGGAGAGFIDEIGLYFEVDEYSGVSMTSFIYLGQSPERTISDYGIVVSDTSYYYYSSRFSGGFFETYISPYDVTGPDALALLTIALAGLGWSRKRSQAKSIDSTLTAIARSPA